MKTLLLLMGLLLPVLLMSQLKMLQQEGDLIIIESSYVKGGKKQQKLRKQMGNVCNGVDIQVNYSAGFTSQAQTAFQHAVDIWKKCIRSDQTIVIDANWEPHANSNNLGSARAGTYFANFSNTPFLYTFYPVALAEYFAGYDLEPDSADIVANFNSSRSDWYFGTDGNCPSNQYDLVSVVLHEIGHGLGIAGSGFSDNTAANSFIGFNSGMSHTSIFDNFVEDDNGNRIDTYTNFTQGMLDVLRSNDLFFDGPNSREANSNNRLKLYAPNPFEPGSSYSHLDESTYPNTLMTPSLSNGEVIHQIDILSHAILKDIGWLEPACDYFVVKDFLLPHLGNVYSTLTYATSDAPVDSRLIFDTSGTHDEVTTSPLIINQAYLIISNLPAGQSSVVE